LNERPYSSVAAATLGRPDASLGQHTEKGAGRKDHQVQTHGISLPTLLTVVQKEVEGAETEHAENGKE